MAHTHNLGFPRIGSQRELKFKLDAYFKKSVDIEALERCGLELQQRYWQAQSCLDLIPVGDFSFYDHVLDASFLLGNVPERVRAHGGEIHEQYFRAARGRSANDSDCQCVRAAEMTKWFDTNYHYIVPEFDSNTRFTLQPERLLAQIQEAKKQGVTSKPVIVGPLSYLWLGKTKDGSQALALLERLVPVYKQLLTELASAGITWLQLDEPILATELSSEWQKAFEVTYHQLHNSNIKVLLATYFGPLKDNLQLSCKLPVAGLHIDAISARSEVNTVIDWLPSNKCLSLGIINGRNIWKSDLNAILDWLEPISKKLGERLWIAPSCSLIHVPIDLSLEQKIDSEIKNWLAFALQKLDELTLIAQALKFGRESVNSQLHENAQALLQRKTSTQTHKPALRAKIKTLNTSNSQRKSPYSERARKQAERFQLPCFPTTTIGSFPQTPELRQARAQFKQQQINSQHYYDKIKAEIARTVREQEVLKLDVLVHGEAERNDMVEYFGEQLEGYTFSQFGWVQSYGSRCVKPPILFGDIERKKAITIEWTQYAQSLTDKPMKAMLTGPVTILNWSFVRDDQARSETCKQLALAIREEVLDLERSGIGIIQIDEAALREGLPLHSSQWAHYLDWATECFRISANSVKDETQIHTHMCYSEFNDIIDSIAGMDADVITIETSRSDLELLDVFEKFNYPNEIGPGVYDIHSPNTPSVESIVALIQAAALRIPKERLWINPDCGLKTRQWNEVLPALRNMQKAAKKLRELNENL